MVVQEDPGVDSQLLDLNLLSIVDVLRNGQMLLSSEGSEYATLAGDLQQQRKQLMQRMGLDFMMGADGGKTSLQQCFFD